VPPVPKPTKKSKAQRRLEALDRRIRHYGGAHDWPETKERVFVRARYRCEGCGIDHCVTGTALQVCHLDAVGMGGRISVDETRMVALCVSCHHELDQGLVKAAMRERMEAIAQTRRCP
jgi:5-methylcytosine-specific restriction endonuclease McrA